MHKQLVSVRVMLSLLQPGKLPLVLSRVGTGTLYNYLADVDLISRTHALALSATSRRQRKESPPIVEIQPLLRRG